MDASEKHLRLGAAVASIAIPLALVGAFVALRPQPHAPERVAAKAVAQPQKPRDVIAQMPASETRSVLEQLYLPTDGDLLWSGDGTALRRTRALTDAFETTSAQGIDVSKVAAARDAALAAPKVEAARLDIALTEQVLVLARALRFGQVPDSRIEDWHVASDAADIVPDLAAALKSTQIDDYLRSLSPNDAQYTGLVDALARYRAMAAAGAWPQIVSDGELKVDLADPRIETLRQRLSAEGFLDRDTGLSKSTLIAALQAFQAHNGLEPDGRIGKGTLAALNTPADTRIVQILANLERRRHVPRAVSPDRIAVNTADQSLVLYRDGEPSLHLRTIVGDRKHPTPMLAIKLSAITLNPAWEIPPSIASKEILPHLQRNPAYLAENDMTVVEGPVDDPQGVRINWRRYSAMPWRLRQEPGARNALGQIKFEMWNSDNIYLHDTPSRNLFEKPERYLSHGCVRVDQPRLLAQQVLMDQSGWDDESLTAAIATGETATIRLKQPIPVQIMYWTAFVDEAGELQFREDAYRRDAALAQALGFAPKRAPAQIAARDQ